MLTLLVGVVCMIGTMTLDLDVAAQLCNFGTFTSFIIVCVAVLILRKIDPDRPRPFKVPCSPLFPSLGIAFCGGLMLYSMKSLTASALMFPVWLLIGLVIYLQYGYVKNRKTEMNKLNSTNKDEKELITK